MRVPGGTDAEGGGGGCCGASSSNSKLREGVSGTLTCWGYHLYNGSGGDGSRVGWCPYTTLRSCPTASAGPERKLREVVAPHLQALTAGPAERAWRFLRRTCPMLAAQLGLLAGARGVAGGTAEARAACWKVAGLLPGYAPDPQRRPVALVDPETATVPLTLGTTGFSGGSAAKNFWPRQEGHTDENDELCSFVTFHDHVVAGREAYDAALLGARQQRPRLFWGNNFCFTGLGVERA